MATIKPFPKRMYMNSGSFQFFLLKTILEQQKGFTQQDILELLSKRCISWEAESYMFLDTVKETLKLLTEGGALTEIANVYHVVRKVEIEV